MTTPNLKEIKDAIANLKEKRLKIIGLQEDLEDLQGEFYDLYEAFLSEPAYAEIVEIASEIALLNDLGGSDDISVEQFPVDDSVENWEAKDSEVYNEEFKQAFKEAYERSSSDPEEPTPEVTGTATNESKPFISYNTPAASSDATPGLSDDAKTADIGDSVPTSTDEKSAKKP